MKEYLQRVYNSILAHPDLLQLGDGMAQLLVQQAQSVVLMHKYEFTSMYSKSLFMFCISGQLRVCSLGYKNHKKM